MTHQPTVDTADLVAFPNGDDVIHLRRSDVQEFLARAAENANRPDVPDDINRLRARAAGTLRVYLPGLTAAECCPDTADINAVQGRDRWQAGDHCWVYDPAVMLLGLARITAVGRKLGAVLVDVYRETVERVDEYPWPIPDGERP